MDEQQQAIVAEIRIIVLPSGQVRVGGPLGDKLLCLGAMELAKKVIQDFDPAKQGKIVLPEPVLNGPRM